MIKKSNFDEKKFKPGFSIDPIDEDSKTHILIEGEKNKS